MFRRFMSLMLVLVVLSAFLVACGDDNSPLPTYAGATSVTNPDATKSISDVFTSSNKDAKVTSFTTADAPDKVKSFFTDNFKKNGWNDKSGDKSIADSSTQLSGVMNGAFVQAFEKGNHKAVIVAFPGASASLLGYQNVADTGTAYMVVDANT